jgi:seipin
LDLPESEANKQLGMFMVQLKLTGKEGKLIAYSRRTAMLRYKSYTLHLLSTMVFSPFLLAGPMEEKQTLKIEMFTDYLENRVRNAILFCQPIQINFFIFI